MSGSKKAVIIIVVILIIGGFVGFGVFNFLRQNQDTDAALRNAITVQMEAAHAETITAKVNAKGTAQLRHKVVVYPQSQARIKAVHVQVGDLVTEGQTLITYDATSLKELRDELEDAKLSLRQAELALEAAQMPATASDMLLGENQIIQAERAITDAQYQIRQQDLTISQIENTVAERQNEYNNKLFLYEQGVIPKTDLDAADELLKEQQNLLETAQTQRETAVTAQAAAEAGLEFAKKQQELVINSHNDEASRNSVEQQQVLVEQARLNVERFEKEIGDFKLEETAPEAGTVLSMEAVEGDMAAYGKTLMEIADLSGENVVVLVDVPENRAAGVSVAQDVVLTGSALGKASYLGKITKIYPLAESKQTGNTVESVIVAEVSPADIDTAIKPGYTLDADIVTKVTENAVVVPLMSLLTDDDGNDFVYIAREDSTVEKRVIKMGTYTGLYVEAGGVSEGEMVIVSPSNNIKEGVYVKPLTIDAEA